MKQQVCNGCRRMLPYSAFNRDSRVKSGRRVTCKACRPKMPTVHKSVIPRDAVDHCCNCNHLLTSAGVRLRRDTPLVRFCDADCRSAFIRFLRDECPLAARAATKPRT